MNPGFKGFELTAQIAKDYKALKPDKRQIYEDLYKIERQKQIEQDWLFKVKKTDTDQDYTNTSVLSEPNNQALCNKVLP